MESEKSGFVNKMSEIWRKMQVKISISFKLILERLSHHGLLFRQRIVIARLRPPRH